MEKLAEWLFVGTLVVCLLLEVIGTPIVNAVKEKRSEAERRET